MAGRKRTRVSRSRAAKSDVLDVYQEMLAEATTDTGLSTSVEPPAKRLKRPGERKMEAGIATTSMEAGGVDEDEAQGIEFEDVTLPQATIQTMYRDSEDDDDEEEEDDDDDEELKFENIDFATMQPESDAREEPQTLTLNLSEHGGTKAGIQKRTMKRKPITKEEKERRIFTHRTHLLCLILHCALRNRWCNDEQAQRSLRPLLSKKTINYLTPGPSLPQFGQTESLKNGLQQAGSMFKSKFQITERGLRRPLWAEDPKHLDNYELPANMDSCLNRSDFRDAARKLCGSRDVGAQLYCALLRSVGVRARLVCSLQPLSFVHGGPNLPKPRSIETPIKPTREDKIRTQLSRYRAVADESPSSASGLTSPLRRLGHPNAAAYQLPLLSTPPPAAQKSKETPKRIHESPFPVYWVEVLDVGHQKWQPVDPLVTNSIWKPKALEPPATDKENSLTYVIAFDNDGTVRDVTRRYAKAYTAKTRRLRIETAVDRGDRWWRKALEPFALPWPTDLDQIEDNELNATEGREPMPRNVADFKDHPVFALERHLRRNEVLIPGSQPAGTVAAGSRAPLEKVYRRKDVRIARSRDKWYRMGREVKPMEVPVKFLPRRSNTKPGDYVDDGYGGDERNAAGTPVFTQEQTEVYHAPPVVNGRVPKNKFGNIDVYVASMVPEGGVHIHDEFDTAVRAACMLGIDYAPALSGFQFKGKQGTAVFNGVVVAQEYELAVRAVMGGFEDMDAQAELNKRSLAALHTWRRFLVALRIRERVWAGADAEERAEEERRLVGSVEVDTTGGGLGKYSAEKSGGFFTEESVAGDDARTMTGSIIHGEVGSILDGDSETSHGGRCGDEDGDGTEDGAGFELEPHDNMLEDAPSDVTEEYDMVDDEGGGGFLVD
ncbi:Rad4 transglutaminase-like domain-containing protein [Colletotrichum higginsianum IMI 349063]|uniref:Rad4 transglutaminase-like domain-containing protein n=1 Tax=Colletotrichum higginsianum (strain IMI 349063) TaxID=759273 RepID=A0A1B7YF88_COLHI|nr:Rad4 transglutaminase-like domain-containing protein [Colletotrichum higginsianum IMI 349063]OBR10686.1 Rad4 transglutaminase-like domain-containing protein [Colletotrichum higginsianum IMI 349063]